MRICVVTNVYPTREVPHQSAFVHARVKAYLANGHEVLVVMEGNGTDAVYDGVHVMSLSDEAAKAAIRAWQPDVLAIHAPFGFSIRVTEQSSAPKVAWIHGYESLLASFYGYRDGWLQKVGGTVKDLHKLYRLRRFLKTCSSVVFVSQWMREVAQRHVRYVHPNSEVIPNPVDTELFSPAPAGNQRPLGVSVRSLSNRKYGLDLAVAAFSRVNHTSLTIVGSGRLEADLRAQAKPLESAVAFRTQGIPHRQMPELYHAFDYFVSPSRTEAQGVSMCEAMACGLPVVATNVGGIPEFVRNGVDGYLVSPDDASALRQAVSELVKDPERLRAMGQHARDHMLALCSSTLVAEREIHVLEQSVATGRGRP